MRWHVDSLVRVGYRDYFGPEIKRTRKDKGYTQKQLADLTGTSPKFISDVENGKATVQLDKVFDLLLVLDLKVYVSSEDL